MKQFVQGLLAAVVFGAVASSAHAATNLVVNGDFSAGNTGFTSGYAYAAPTAGALYPEGVYTVASNPNDVHPLWINMAEGDDKLIVNGAVASTPTVWQENNLATVAGRTYTFSASAANICCVAGFGGANDPTHLLFQMSSNGGATFTNLADILTSPPLDTGLLHSVSASFTAAGATSFRIVDTLNGQSGNDFAIDNISLTAVPEPSTWAMMLVGAAGLGLALRAGRRQAAAAA